MGRAPCCDKKEGLKKGAWTSEEDEKLVSFIRNNGGHGSWRSLPQLAGLQRCGKSCRLRWTNYLRPNIKRGNFSPEEERTITQLHAILGNKWSSIACHLPGRTDNEVKNHWNTHLKKRLSSMGIDPATHRPINILNSNSNISNCVSLLSNNNNMVNPRSFNCSHTSSSPTSTNLPRVTRMPLLDQSYISHMAQWELARLEAEARLASSSSARLSAATLENSKLNTTSNNTPSGHGRRCRSAWISSPSTYSSSSCLREGDHELFQDFPELLEYMSTGAEFAHEKGSALVQSFESSSCISSSCVVSNQPLQGHYDSEELIMGGSASAAASMAVGSPEAEITSDITHLLHDDRMMMSATGPSAAALIALDQPCEASHAYWANLLSGLVGPVMSCSS